MYLATSCLVWFLNYHPAFHSNIRALISTSFSHHLEQILPQVLFFISLCIYLLECVIQTGSVQFRNSSSQHCLPQKEIVDLSHFQSINTDAAELQLRQEDSCISATSAHKSTADLISLHPDFCLFNLWIPKQISVWSRCRFFCIGWYSEAGCLTAGRWKLWWSTWRPRVDWMWAWKSVCWRTCC